MKTEICFIRHGETAWNQEGRIQGTIDNPLNQDGINDAKKVASYLKERDPHWHIILSSPLSRAKETANYIQKELELPEVLEESDLIERQFGKAEGVIITKELYQNIMSENIEGLEPGSQIQERVHRATLAIANRYPGQRVLVVAHSHVIKALISRLDARYSFQTPIKNVSLTTFIYDNETLSIQEINQVVI